MIALWLALACAPHAPEVTPLPSAGATDPHRLILMTHGYVGETEAMRPLIDTLTRDGVPRAWLDGGEGQQRYHVHAFDFGRFSRLASDHNVSIEALARAFGQFYHQLPETCPVCRDREDERVEVALLGWSFGGLVMREFLLQEALDHSGEPRVSAHGPEDWEIDRVVTLATPWFGSLRTRLTRGFLSMTVNGGIRTLIYGFFNPRKGEVWGNVIDEQERALKFGSVFQWRQHQRWRELAWRQEVPPWLVVAAVGHNKTALQGDGVTRFASANVAPLLPDAPMETFLTDVKHMEMFREVPEGPKSRELAWTLRAVTSFIERGSLAADDSGWLDTVTVEAASGDTQTFYLQAPTDDPEQQADLATKKEKLTALYEVDQGDVWLRFFDGRRVPPALLPLNGMASLFRRSEEYSRAWTELSWTAEPDADGVMVPVVQSLDLSRSHLVAIPDLQPTGAYSLKVRLASPESPRGVPVRPSEVVVTVDGQDTPPESTGEDITLWIHPHRTNLVSVYLDTIRILQEHPELETIEIRDIALVPMGQVATDRAGSTSEQTRQTSALDQNERGG